MDTMRMIQVVASSLAIAAVTVTIARADSPLPAPVTVPPGDHDGQSDFDFLVGTWKVRNRVLDGRLQGSTTWFEYDSDVIERAIWGGKAIVEEWDGVSPKRHVQGLAVRMYDPSTKQWKLWWADRSFATIFTPPSVGSFKNGRGEFFSDSVADGKPFRSRCTWAKLTKDKLRWEQAYSADGGKTWETNWIMDFTRAAP
jgi:hypothetical protein